MGKLLIINRKYPNYYVTIKQINITILIKGYYIISLIYKDNIIINTNIIIEYN